MAKQKATTKKKPTAEVVEDEDGGNSMGLTAEEMQDWMEVQEALVEKGYGPDDVRDELLRKHPKAAAGSGAGLMASARTTLNKKVKWKHVVYFAVGVIGFIGLLKLIGMAFEINIPIIHKAMNEPDLEI